MSIESPKRVCKKGLELDTFWNRPVLNRDLARAVEDDGFHGGLLGHDCYLLAKDFVYFR